MATNSIKTLKKESILKTLKRNTIQKDYRLWGRQT